MSFPGAYKSAICAITKKKKAKKAKNKCLFANATTGTKGDDSFNNFSNKTKGGTRNDDLEYAGFQEVPMVVGFTPGKDSSADVEMWVVGGHHSQEVLTEAAATNTSTGEGN